MRQTQRSPEGPRHLHRIPRLSEAPWDQADIRKHRGTRDQIANIRWIMEKAREFPKNIYFCGDLRELPRVPLRGEGSCGCSFPGENASSVGALGEARPGQSSLSAGALRYRAWAQSWSSAALANKMVLGGLYMVFLGHQIFPRSLRDRGGEEGTTLRAATAV